MKLFVTGGTGYIGENLIPKLIEQGHNITLLVRNIEKAKALFGDKCNYWIGDITDSSSLRGCCKDTDIVFHMAALSGNQLPSEESFRLFRRINVEGTRNVLEESKKSQVSRFIFVSSTAAMGIVKKKPIDEKSICSPILPYQVSKYEAEEVVKKYIEEGFPAIIIRPTKIYGIGEHEYSYLSLARLCKKGFVLKIGSSRNLASYLYISDFVKVLICLINKGVLGQTYIVSSDGSIEFLEAERIIANILKKKARVIYIPTCIMSFFAGLIEKASVLMGKNPVITKSNIKSIASDRVYDISKAKSEISFQPSISMKKGIELVVRWYTEEQLI